MANTPKYTFVEDDPMTPFFQGGLTALSGIMQERNAAQKQKKRLQSFADVLHAQGLHGDAGIYQNLADQEEPDLLTAALSGKAVPRDNTKVLDHALDAIKAKENRETQLEVAGIRSSGSGNRMTLAEQRQWDAIAKADYDAAQNDADTTEREIDRIENQITIASAAGEPETVKKLQEDKARLIQRREEAIKARDAATQVRKQNAKNTFGSVSSDQTPPFLPDGEMVPQVPEGANVATPVSVATARGQLDMPAEREGLFPGTNDLIPPLTSDAVVVPEGKAVPRKFKTDAEAAEAAAGTLKDLGKNGSGKSVKNEDGSFSFKFDEESDIIPSVTEKRPDVTTTAQPASKPGIVERELDSRLSYVDRAKKSLSPDASTALKRSVIALAEAKDNAVARFGKNPDIDSAGGLKALAAVVKGLEKDSKYSNEDATPEAAAARGAEMIKALTAQGQDPKNYILSMRVGSGGGFTPLVVKKGGLSVINDSTWVSADGSITYSADKDGFMHLTNNETGESFLMRNPSNPNAGLPKALFAGSVATIGNSQFRDDAPTMPNATDKAVKKGQIPTPAGQQSEASRWLNRNK